MQFGDLLDFLDFLAINYVFGLQPLIRLNGN